MAATKQADPPSLGHMRKFLDTYAKTGSLAGADQAAKITLAIHYQMLETDPAYRKDFEAAQQQVADLLESEAFRRAFAGSDELLMFILRAWRPEQYREHVIQEISGSITVTEPGSSAARGAAAQVFAIHREKVQGGNRKSIRGIRTPPKMSHMSQKQRSRY